MIDDDLQIVIIDDIEPRLIGFSKEARESAVKVKDFFLTEFMEKLGSRFQVTTYSLATLRSDLDRVQLTGACVSLERAAFRRGAIVVGDSYSCDENGALTLICKPGFPSSKELARRDRPADYYIEDICSVSGATVTSVAKNLMACESKVLAVNLAIASRRAIQFMENLHLEIYCCYRYERLKCIELRDLLLSEPQYEFLRGNVVRSAYVQAFNVLGSLPLSKREYDQLSQSLHFVRKSIADTLT